MKSCSEPSFNDCAPLPVLGVTGDSLSLDSCEDNLFIKERAPAMPIDFIKEYNVSPVDGLDAWQVHEQVYGENTVPENFVDKLVAFHLGHVSLEIDDLTDYVAHLDKTFARFAYHLEDFRKLSCTDRSALLIANAPLYFQLHMCRYINASSGLAQVKALLGPSLPADLADCKKFIAASFRYFASALRLFSDPLWVDRYELEAECLAKFVTDANFALLAPCILFNSTGGTFFDDSEAVEAVFMANVSKLRAAAPEIFPAGIKRLMASLKSMVHCYAGAANITYTNAKLVKTTKVSLTTPPSSQSTEDEMCFWLERQLKICEDKGREVNIGHAVARAVSWHNEGAMSRSELNVQLDSLLIDAMIQRCCYMLWCHHEYRSLYKSSRQQPPDWDAVVSLRDKINGNISVATTFVLAYYQTLSAEERNTFALGEADANVRPKLSIVRETNQPTSEAITAFCIRKTAYDAFLAWVAEAKASTELMKSCPRLVYLATLCILWDTPADSDECFGLVYQLANIRDRYHAYLREQMIKFCGEDRGKHLLDKFFDILRAGYSIDK